MISLFTAASAFVVAAVLLLVWYTTPTYTVGEPAPFPHKVPWLGHGYGFATDRRNLLEKASVQASRRPFSILMAGRKHYVFSSLTDINAIHRMGRALDISPFIYLIMRQLFGISHAGANKICEHRHDFHTINNQYLLRPENNAVTACKYFVELSKKLDGLEKEIESSADGAVVKDGFNLAADTQGEATTIAYFGQELLDMDPATMENFTYYVQHGLWPCMSGAPRWAWWKAYKARESVVTNVKKLIVAIKADPENVASPFITKCVLDESKVFGIDDDTVARHIFSILFGVSSNSIPTSYLALVHVIRIPDLMQDLRAELVSAGYDKINSSEYTNLFPAALPLLRSVFWETLRMHNVASSIREVQEPTHLSGDEEWDLKTGGVVTIPAGMLHMNPDVHPEPEKFMPRRFVEKSLGGAGQSWTKTLKPFGGGVSYCPGRVFAEKQVMGFVANMIMKFDVSLKNSESFVLPDTSDFEYVADCPRALFEIRKRA